MMAATRFDLLSESEPPNGPTALDVLDGQGRLVIKAGQTVDLSMMGRLRRMGILEIFIVDPESKAPGFWDRWGENWYQEAEGRLVLLEPLGEEQNEPLLLFKRVLKDAVRDHVRQKNLETR